MVAIVAGLIGFFLALATPLLPVTQTTAAVNWPQNGVIGDVEAPLMAQVPIDVNASIPCSSVGSLPEGGGILLSTAPAQGAGAALSSMFVRVSATNVDVLDRNVVVASATREDVESGRCTSITFNSDINRTAAEFVGLTYPDGNPLRGQLDGDFRPQVVGVFSDLPDGAAPEGLGFSMTVDSRFSSSPTTLKLVAMITAAISTIIALVALAKLDGTDGRTHRRFLPARWWKFSGLDGVVVGTLVLWHFIGANTADDGYLLTMARVAPDD